MFGLLDGFSVLLILGAALAYVGRHFYRVLAQPRTALRDNEDLAGCAATCRVADRPETLLRRKS